MQRINRRNTNAKVTTKDQQPLEQTINTVKVETSTNTPAETIIEQPKENEEFSDASSDRHSATPIISRPRRTRRVVGATNSETKLIRAPLKQAVVASQQSAEIWALVQLNYSKGYQKEEIYFVGSELIDGLSDHVRPIKVQVVLNQDSSYSLFYTKLTDGYENSWMDSAEACSEQLEQDWGRIISDQIQQEYLYVPDNKGKSIPDASTFPDLDEMIEKVFANRTIDSLKHPVLEEMNIYVNQDFAA